ncbi:hypothetical protein Bbelb_272490 [Branchiostoma belcheri]|nr:hypothetical protein Bbelb_272490 [Branchiostoma belcheri]
MSSISKKHNITLLGLPPHSTHIMQPLDAGGVLHALKASYSKQARAVILTKDSHVMRPCDLPAVVRGAYLRSVANPEIMEAAFDKCGLWPVSQERALTSQQLRISITHQTAGKNKSSQDQPSTSEEQPSTSDDVDSGLSTDSSGNSWLEDMVQQKLIPPHLARHLLTPVCTSTPKRKRIGIQSGAKVFTKEEFILEKEAQQKKRDDAELKKEERRKQRESRKADEMAMAAQKREKQKKETGVKQKKEKGIENAWHQMKAHILKNVKPRNQDQLAEAVASF